MVGLYQRAKLSVKNDCHRIAPESRRLASSNNAQLRHDIERQDMRATFAFFQALGLDREEGKDI